MQTCQAFGRIRLRDVLGYVEDPKWLGELLSLHFLGPIKLKSQGKLDIPVLIYRLTQWSWAVGCDAYKTANAIPSLVE